MLYETFEFEGNKIRVFDTKEAIWFAGKDTAKAMGYSNPTTTIFHSLDKEYKSTLASLIGAAQCDKKNFNKNDLKSIYINREGIVYLAFNSVLPSAKKFKKWILEEMFFENNNCAKLLEENTRLKKKLEEIKNDADREKHTIYSILSCENNNLKKTIIKLEEQLAREEITHRLAEKNDNVFYIATTPDFRRQNHFKCGFAARDKVQDILREYSDDAYCAKLFECRDCANAKKSIAGITKRHRHRIGFCNIMMDYEQLEKIVQNVCDMLNSLYLSD